MVGDIKTFKKMETLYFSEFVNQLTARSLEIKVEVLHVLSNCRLDRGYTIENVWYLENFYNVSVLEAGHSLVS